MFSQQLPCRIPPCDQDPLRGDAALFGRQAAPQCRWLALVGWVVLWSLVGQSVAFAQLTILSRGDADAKWRSSQMSVLEQQLAEAGLGDELKQELESQQKWLRHWRPGQLTEKPLWESDLSLEPYSEPVVDPEQRAGKVREVLLGDNATPTTADTKSLQKLLQQYPEDVGVRQLHLHWLDQLQYRKTYPDEIAEAALRLAAMLEGLSAESNSSELTRARAHCLYRRGRALAYRELPDVVAKQPIENPDAHAAALLGTYRQLKQLVAESRPEFVLLDVRMLRRDRWNGRALVLLEDFGDQLSQQWFLKKRRDLLRDLGFLPAAAEAEKLYAQRFPEALQQEKDQAGE